MSAAPDKKRRMGRPSPIDDPEKVERLLKGLTIGMPRRHAANWAGIGESTFMRWMQLSDDPSRKYDHYRDLRDKVREAEGQLVGNMLMIVNKDAAENVDGRLALDLLGRRFRAEFSQRGLVSVAAAAASEEIEGAGEAGPGGTSRATATVAVTFDDGDVLPAEYHRAAQDLLRRRRAERALPDGEGGGDAG